MKRKPRSILILVVLLFNKPTQLVKTKKNTQLFGGREKLEVLRQRKKEKKLGIYV